MTPLFLRVSISCLFLGFHGVFGQLLQNRTIDDNDPAIRYSGDWSKSNFITLNEGGYHMLTRDPNARATFEFTGKYFGKEPILTTRRHQDYLPGVAIYFMSSLWPYDVTTQVQLDSRPSQLLNLRDLNSPDTGDGWETVQSHIVWAAKGLDNTRHTLTITVGPGEEWAIVDAFM